MKKSVTILIIVCILIVFIIINLLCQNIFFNINFDKQINKLREEIIGSTINLIKIPSVAIKSEDSLSPFGSNVNDALEYVLDLATELGFENVKNIDGKAGYVEFGQGAEMVGVIVHLDVISGGYGWTYPPFEGTIEDGKIYGRGATDDKGPAIASLYAMKAVKDSKVELNKRVRLIIGLSEEINNESMEYYLTKEEEPTLGFCPDAEFPVVYIEKGGMYLRFISQANKDSEENILINYIGCDNVLGVVPSYSKIRLEINSIEIEEFEKVLNRIVEKHNQEVDTYQVTENEIEITFFGDGDYSFYRKVGISPISSMIIIINELFDTYNIENPTIEFLHDYIIEDLTGTRLDINHTDYSGDTEIFPVTMSHRNEQIETVLNIKCPVTGNIVTMMEKIEQKANEKNIIVECISTIEPFESDKDSELVKTLTDVYNQYTNSSSEPISVNGRTYARAFKNIVPFGAVFPNEKLVMHQADEYINIDSLILATKIYAKAIYELAK